MSCVLSLLLCVLPQGEGSLSGRVLDVAGKPAAGAVVTLLHRPIARHLDPAREHRVVVTTDERGAFRAPLHADTIYSAWAGTDAAASAVAEGIAAGDFLELPLRPRTGPQQVKADGFDAWDDAATFRCRAVVGGEALDFVDVPRRDGVLHAPALPPMSSRTIEVLDADGCVLWAGQAGPGEHGLAFTLPPPATYTVQVKDPSGGPLAGVEVRRHVINYWATESDAMPFGDRFVSLWPSQGKTGADGRLALRVPQWPAERNLWLLSRLDGHRMSADGLQAGKLFRDGRELPAGQQDGVADPVHVVLTPAPPPEPIQLKNADGTPAAAATWFAKVHVNVRDKTGAMGTPLLLPFAVVDGIATMPCALPDGAELQDGWTVMAPALRKLLREQHGFAPPLAIHVPTPARLAKQPLLDANTFHVLRVVAADGRPAAHAVVHVRQGPRDDGSLVRTDRLGRVLLERRGDVRAIVFGRLGFGAIAIAADKKQPSQLELLPVQTAGGRIVDAEGKPVADAAVSTALTNDASGELQRGDLTLLSQLLGAPPVDADGLFEVLLPCVPTTVNLWVSSTSPPARVQSTFQWDPAVPGQRFDLELRPR